MTTSKNLSSDLIAISSDTSLDINEAVNAALSQFGIMLINARKKIKSQAAAIHPDLQITGFKALTIIFKFESISQVMLAQEIGIDKAVMSRTIKQLEELSLIMRSKDPLDRRSSLIMLTADGVSHMETNREQGRQEVFKNMSTWDLEEINRFTDLLSRLNKE